MNKWPDGCVDRLMNKRLGRWVYGLMDGLLVGRIAKGRVGWLDVWMADWI